MARHDRILLVEDDEGNREALRELLEVEGYTVSTAAHGAEALALLRRGGDPPRLILLDMMMPVMNGSEFRQAQQRDPELRDIPVVLMSAGARLTDEALALDVAAVIGKPPNVDAMLAALARLCDRK